MTFQKKSLEVRKKNPLHKIMDFSFPSICLTVAPSTND